MYLQKHHSASCMNSVESMMERCATSLTANLHITYAASTDQRPPREAGKTKPMRCTVVRTLRAEIVALLYGAHGGTWTPGDVSLERLARA